METVVPDTKVSGWTTRYWSAELSRIQNPVFESNIPEIDNIDNNGIIPASLFTLKKCGIRENREDAKLFRI